MNYFETNEATFNPNLEKIEETDRVHADTPNKRFEQLINNDVAIKNQLYNHNHDGAYSNINHNHNETYANINHKHNEYVENVDLETKLTGLAKEKEEYSIENKVKEISTEVKNIKSNISQSLQGLAKERIEYSIEDKVKEIENKLILLEEKEKLKNWLSSPSTIIKTTQLNNINDKIIVEITGSGYLAICLFNNLIHGTAGTQSYKVEIDDEIVFDTKVNFRNSWETGDGTSGKVSQIGIFNSSFYTYIENEDKLGMSIPILNYGKPFIIGSNLDRLKPLSSTKNTVSNTDGLIKTSAQYHAYHVPVGIKIENLLRFEKKLKISTYDTQGMSYTNQGAINCLCAYQLDE